MEPNLSFLANRPVSPASNEPNAAVATPAAGTATAEKTDFAQVLSGQTLKVQRQHLAALEAPGEGLQVVPLGNKINVITSDAPLPDMASLAKFARLQGLDEAAVQALFGATTVAKVSALNQSADAADALTASVASADPLALTAASVMPAVTALAAAPSALPSPINTSNPTATLVPVTPAPTAIGAAVTPDASVQTGGSTSSDKLQMLLNSPASRALQTAVQGVSVPASMPTARMPAPSLPDARQSPAAEAVPLPTAIVISPSAVKTTPLQPPLPTLLPPGPALPAAATPSGAEATTTASVTAAIAASAASSSLLPLQPSAWIGKAEVAAVDAPDISTPLSPQDAVRLTLAMPAPEITKRLAQMSGTGKETTWAALLASGPASKGLPAATDTVVLDLPAGFDADLLAPTADSGQSQPSDLSTQAGAGAPALAAMNTASAAGGSNAGNAQAQADHRAQQFQQLADQMGQAAAQRLMAQIERGQWKMQMRMQPASLGNINVELDMHAGGLDALFSTDNAVTRDLMAQGSNKLRDTLTQSGMTVASVTVNGEQSRQSGGNSTPGKGRGTSLAQAAARVSTSAAVASAPAVETAENDGLNLLA